MTVAFVNSTRKWGGVKSWTLAFGGALAERGHRIVAVVRRGNPFETACRSAGFNVYPVHFGFKYNPAAMLRLWRVFRRERPDVVVVNISRDLEVGAVAARLCGLPVIHRVGLVEDFRGTLEEKLQHRLLVDRIVVPAHWMKTALVHAQPWIQPERVCAVPNGRKVDTYLPAEGSGTDEVVFGCASQLSPSKGHSVLLDALARLVGKGLPVRLRVAGAGGLYETLTRRTRDLGLEGRVEFAGFVEDLPDFLRHLDVFVLPSLKEGLPNVLLEAMCTGLPCVASDLPGAREVGGDTVLYVPPCDADALACAMESLVRDGSRRRDLGDRARRRVHREYDLDRSAARLEAALVDVAESFGPA